MAPPSSVIDKIVVFPSHIQNRSPNQTNSTSLNASVVDKTHIAIDNVDNTIDRVCGSTIVTLERVETLKRNVIVRKT